VATSCGLPFASLLYLGEKMSAWLSFLLIERYGKVYLIFLFSVQPASQVAWRVYSPCLPSSSLFSGRLSEKPTRVSLSPSPNSSVKIRDDSCLQGFSKVAFRQRQSLCMLLFCSLCAFCLPTGKAKCAQTAKN